MAKKLLLLVAAAAIVLGFGCDKDTTIDELSQAEWTAKGWAYWKAADYEEATRAFGNALKVDPYYGEAYGGLGWTHLREQEMTEAAETFEDAILYSEQDGIGVRQIIYMGAATAYEAMDEYQLSADRGRYMVNNLNGDSFEFGKSRDEHVTGFDLYVILALDYYGLGDSTNCVWAINQMRGKVGEQKNYSFTNWKAVTAEIERLIAKDPS